MAMSRSRGASSLTTRPLTTMSPPVTGSRPAIILQDRALAAAGGADEHDELAVADLEVDAVHDLERAVLLEELLDLDMRHRFSPQDFSIVQLCSWNGRKLSSAAPPRSSRRLTSSPRRQPSGRPTVDGAAGAGGLVGAQDQRAAVLGGLEAAEAEGQALDGDGGPARLGGRR